jgi:cbb3-type cytochrome oxidase subunit 3
VDSNVLMLLFFVGVVAFAAWLLWPRKNAQGDAAQPVGEWDEDEGLPTGEGSLE